MSIKFAIFKKCLCICFCLCVAFAFSVSVSAVQARETSTAITIFGNPFTIDPSSIATLNNDDSLHTWQDVAYRVPKLMPGAMQPAVDNEEIPSIEDVLMLISGMTLKQRDAFHGDIDVLADRLVQDGHFNMVPTNEAVPFMRDRLELMLENDNSDEGKSNILKGYILSWFRTQTLEESIKRYNEYAGKDVVSLKDFEKAYDEYQDFLALYYLDSVIRMSPEFNTFMKVQASVED